jgi:1-aminocyclopropane-1-carboxylate deaminase
MEKRQADLEIINSKSIFLGSHSLTMLREDQIHPIVSGNKFRKLKYNLLAAKEDNMNTLLTFGGAYSNHIAAVAAVGKEFGFKTIGIIRGEEIADKVDENPTLSLAMAHGMQLEFISRDSYRDKNKSFFIDELKMKYGDFYFIPEGGTNSLAVKGCAEILSEITINYDYICVAVGTGGTIAGIINASQAEQTIIGFSALKGNFQKKEVLKYTNKRNFEITDRYCFGGYAKIDTGLVRFINEFYLLTNIPLDPVYTGKMMYGILNLIKREEFNKNSRILAVHTGGLQGISGMNKELLKRNLPQIIS